MKQVTPFFNLLSDDDVLLPRFFETAIRSFAAYSEEVGLAADLDFGLMALSRFPAFVDNELCAIFLFIRSRHRRRDYQLARFREPWCGWSKTSLTILSSILWDAHECLRQ